MTGTRLGPEECQAGRVLNCLVHSLFRRVCPVADGLNTRIFGMKTRYMISVKMGYFPYPQAHLEGHFALPELVHSR